MMRDSKTKSAITVQPHVKCTTSSQYGHYSLKEDDGEHNDADNGKYGEVLPPRHTNHGGLRKFNEHEEFNDNEYEKDIERVDVE
jgi:hypothetical protein